MRLLRKLKMDSPVARGKLSKDKLRGQGASWSPEFSFCGPHFNVLNTNAICSKIKQRMLGGCQMPLVWMNL